MVTMNILCVCVYRCEMCKLWYVNILLFWTFVLLSNGAGQSAFCICPVQTGAHCSVKFQRGIMNLAWRFQKFWISMNNVYNWYSKYYRLKCELTMIWAHWARFYIQNARNLKIKKQPSTGLELWSLGSKSWVITPTPRNLMVCKIYIM